MLAALRTAAVLGIDAVPVTVEVDVAKGLPGWTMVGLAATSVRESRERVATALHNSGFTIPPRRVTVALAPADLRKDGAAFDLPIALALLVATGQLDAAAVEGIVFLGEVGLDGTLRPVRGVLPVARRVVRDAHRLVVPPANVAEALLAPGLALATAPTLAALVEALRAGRLPAAEPSGATAPLPDASEDLCDVAGQPKAKRALEIAAAGGHNLLMVGAPGAGKTMLARRLPGLLPPLDEAQRLEVVAIHSVGGLLRPGVVPAAVPPFRAPHATVSLAGLIGGGPGPRPGEVSLAHHGVLLLDEMLELPRHILDALRQPLEDRRVVLARAAQAVSYPARFQLIAASNPCPCGHALSPGSRCRCSESDILRYRARLSGPLADRIDLQVKVAAVEVAALGAAGGGEPSAAVRARVLAARARQAARFAELPGVGINADAPGPWLWEHGGVTPGARAALAAAAEQRQLSARAYHRILRVARTIADLDGADRVGEAAVHEAATYRD